MRRRDFVKLTSSIAVTWPFGARAQGRLPVVGYLGATSREADRERAASFVQRLRELGWIEGRTVRIEYRWADARAERYPEIAAEFVDMKVDVIVLLGAAAPAVRKVTSAIPIVFTADADPVGNGLVESLARPGGNVTGLSTQAPDLVAKRLELLHEAVPNLHRLGVLANVGWPEALKQAREVETAALKRGLVISGRLDIRTSEDVTPAFEALKSHADALYVVADPLMYRNLRHINTLVLGARLATITSSPEYVEAGCLMSYGVSVVDLFGRAADYVDKILHGTGPAAIPVEQPTKFYLAVNVTTAKALGLTIPETFLLRADKVIE